MAAPALLWHREKTAFMQSKFLFDIYMREGHDHLAQKQYRKAIQSYDAALEFEPSNIAAHVAKSQCHLHLGHVTQALADVETALAADNVNPQAVLQKADIFYSLGNFEMALLFYHRGHKVSPGVKAFKEGIQLCQKHMQEKEKGRCMKMTVAGDLTVYVHKKMRKMAAKRHEKHLSRRTTPLKPASAGVQPETQVNPLVRLQRKRPIKLEDTPRRANQRTGRVSRTTVMSEPDEKTMREILGELYDDKLYLQELLLQTEALRIHPEVSPIAEGGLQFLHDRITYWSIRRLPPNPPPSPPLSRKHTRQGSGLVRQTSLSPLPRQKSSLYQRDVSDLIRELDEDNFSEGQGQKDNISGYRPFKKQKKKVRVLHFEFASYRPETEMHERERGGRVEDGETRGGMKVEDGGEGQEPEEEEEEDYIMNYLVKELLDVEQAFDDEDFSECKRRAISCLQTVYNYDDDEIADKRDVIARVHSILGNALIELHEYAEAIEHHEKDLQVGEECNIEEPVSRALGNLGRAYFSMNSFNKALGAFARKTKLVQLPLERAWLYHEIGNCFLSLNQCSYARDAGKKSLQAAQDATHRMYQLQACVLIGVAQVKLKEYHEAYSVFEAGLDLARTEGDKQSEAVITRALAEVNTKISEKTRRDIEGASDDEAEKEDVQTTKEETEHGAKREEEDQEVKEEDHDVGEEEQPPTENQSPLESTNSQELTSPDRSVSRQEEHTPTVTERSRSTDGGSLLPVRSNGNNTKGGLSENGRSSTDAQIVATPEPEIAAEKAVSEQTIDKQTTDSPPAADDRTSTQSEAVSSHHVSSATIEVEDQGKGRAVIDDDDDDGDDDDDEDDEDDDDEDDEDGDEEDENEEDDDEEEEEDEKSNHSKHEIEEKGKEQHVEDKEKRDSATKGIQP